MFNFDSIYKCKKDHARSNNSSWKMKGFQLYITRRSNISSKTPPFQNHSFYAVDSRSTFSPHNFQKCKTRSDACKPMMSQEWEMQPQLRYLYYRKWNESGLEYLPYSENCRKSLFANVIWVGNLWLCRVWRLGRNWVRRIGVCRYSLRIAVTYRGGASMCFSRLGISRRR